MEDTMLPDEHDMFIDTDIPLEQQITFLRRHAVGARIDTYVVLKERLGDQGVELFREILRRGYAAIAAMAQSLDFQTIAAFAGYSDHMMGLPSKVDYIKEDAFQYSITRCPYLDACRERGLDASFCHVFEEVYISVVNKSIGELTEPERLCDGDGRCVFTVRNTLCK